MQTMTATNGTINHRIQSQRVEDLQRLAAQGEAKGVSIKLTPDGQHVANSVSDPTRAYVVSVEAGCQCRGYQYWSRCQHHSLLMAELGMLASEDDAEPETYEVSDLPESMVANVQASFEVGMSPRDELIDDAAWMIANHFAEQETGIQYSQVLFLNRFVNDQAPAEREMIATYRAARESLLATARRLVEQIANPVPVPGRYDVVLSEETRDLHHAA